MAQTAIELSNVSKKYNQAGYFAVDHVSLSIEEGEFITILGSGFRQNYIDEND